MPISLLEAMSYGCNCLVSNIEENVQVTKEYAMCFQKGNVKDLKDKLEDILKKEKENSEVIRNYVIKNYNWNEVVEKTIGIYKEQ